MRTLNLTPSSRPITTLFMLTSVDGKISTGPTDDFDFDKDLPSIVSADGLQKYYDLEKETDLWTLCTGRTLEKVYRLQPAYEGPQLPVTCVVVDSGHLTPECYQILCRKFERVIIATYSQRYYSWVQAPQVLMYNARDMKHLFLQLHRIGCRHLTLQAGGTLNTELIRAGLVDYVSLVVAPCIVGGKETPSVFSGVNPKSLGDICSLSAASVKLLGHDFVLLTYKVDKRD